MVYPRMDHGFYFVTQKKELIICRNLVIEELAIAFEESSTFRLEPKLQGHQFALCDYFSEMPGKTAQTNFKETFSRGVIQSIDQMA